MKSWSFAFGILLTSQICFAQIGIGTTTPNASTILDISSTTKGMRIPQMSTAQRNAITTPVAGLQILNTDDFCFDIYDGSAWVKNCGLRVTGTDTMPSTWTQRANYGGGIRTGAVAFTLYNKGYVGTGYDGAYKKDFWEFDPATNMWTQKADLGGNARAYAASFVAFSVVDKGHVCTGYNGGYLNDTWAYDPFLNSWQQKANFPGTPRAYALGFRLENYGFVGTGTSNGTNRLGDMYSYNPVSNVWLTAANINQTVFYLGLNKAAAIPLGSYAMIGTGEADMAFPFSSGETDDFIFFASNNGLGAWDPSINTSYPGGPRSNVTVCGHLVGFGKQNGAFTSDVYEYNAGPGTWTPLLIFPGSARSEATGFVASSRYFFCGGTSSGPTYKNDLWEYIKYPMGNVYTSPASPSPTYSVNDGLWTLENNKVYNSNTGNIGIGTSNPSTKLDIDGTLKTSGLAQFNSGAQVTGTIKWDNGLSNRKIILYESGANDHQYYGFGINGSTLRYQVANPGDNHVFYAGVNATTSKELMRIVGNGNVGINLSGPANRLDLNHGTGRIGSHPSNLGLYVTSNSTSAGGGVEFRHENGTQGIGFGFNTIYATGSNADQNLYFSSRGNGQLLFNTNNAERLRITETGYIGIQNTLPSDWLHVGHMNMLANSYISLSSTMGYKTGLRMKHGSTAWGWTVESDDIQHKFIIRRHYDSNPGTESMAIDLFTGNVTFEGSMLSEGYTAPTLLNSFSNYGAEYAPVTFWKDKMGIVHLRGLINRGGDPDNLAMFVLPAGYRPSSGRLIFNCMNNNGSCRVDVLQDGTVQVVFGDTGWISLSEIRFRAD